MIRPLGVSNGTNVVEIAGTPEHLAKEAAILVQAVYNSLYMQDKAAGELFRRTFIAEYEKGTLWGLVPAQVHTLPRRPGPVIPTQ